MGGGVAGLGVAWRCAQRGLAVTLVEPAAGTGASHVAAGMIAPVTEVAYGEEGVLALNLESARRWPQFAAELGDAAGVELPYVTDGTLAVAFSADDRRALADLARFQADLGLDVERLRSRECRDVEPGLAPGIAGGMLVPSDHQVEPRAVVAALATAAVRAGVAVLERRVAAVDCEDGRVRGVRLDDGEFVPATVVVATGAWTRHLDGVPDEVRSLVRPVKGQILRLHGALDRLPIRRTVRALVEGRSVYAVPRSDGEVVVGATVEEQGFDTGVTAEGVYELLRDALTVVPGLADLELAEVAAGLRPATPDNAPLLGATSVDGLVMATGHLSLIHI